MITPGQKITVLLPIAFMDGITTRQITIININDGKPVYMTKRTKKKYYLSFTDDMLVFDGWVLPFNSTSLNGQVNHQGEYEFQVGDPAQLIELRSFILTKNLNPHFNKWDKVVYRYAGSFKGRIFTEEELNHLIAS